MAAPTVLGLSIESSTYPLYMLVNALNGQAGVMQQFSLVLNDTTDNSPYEVQIVDTTVLRKSGGTVSWVLNSTPVASIVNGFVVITFQATVTALYPTQPINQGKLDSSGELTITVTNNGGLSSTPYPIQTDYLNAIGQA